jgi:hypothetical protein
MHCRFVRIWQKFRGIFLKNMEQIVADRYVADTLRFVQDHINDPCVTREVRDSMIAAYQNVSNENAEKTFHSVSKLHELAITQAREITSCKITENWDFHGVTWYRDVR